MKTLLLVSSAAQKHSLQLVSMERTVLAVHTGGLVLEDKKSLLESLNLGIASCSALLVGLWLCNAAFLDLAIIPVTFLAAGEVYLQFTFSLRGSVPPDLL